MGQLREVTRFERIVFPIMATIIISLLLPPIASLIGMLMLGNLFRESGVMMIILIHHKMHFVI